MPFGLDEAIAGWLLAELGGAIKNKLSDPQKHALRKVVKKAVEATVDDVASHLGQSDRRAVLNAIRDRGLDGERLNPAPGTGQLEGLREYIAELDIPEFGDSGYLAQIGVDAEQFWQVLAHAIRAGIDDDALTNGPLGPLAAVIRHSEVLERIDRLAELVPPALAGAPLAELDGARQDPRDLFEHVELSRFTGRQWLTVEVDRFLAQNPCGYIWIEAEAGLGKTTYAAHLVHDRGYLSHFSRLSGADRAEAVLQNLAAQVISTVGLDRPAPGSTQTPESFARLLAAAARQADGSLVLVIDGLDEIQAAGTPVELPLILPTGVYVIGTYRTGSAPKRGAGSRQLTLKIEPGNPDNLADIRQHLSNTADDAQIVAMLARRGVPREDFISGLAARCSGVWVYLHYVLSEIRWGQREVDEIHDLPADILDYYTQSIDRWQNAADWTSVRLPLLATLAVATEPLGIDALADLAGATEKTPVQEFCAKVARPFLTAQASPFRYSIHHAGFREFLQGGLPSLRNGEHPDERQTMAEELGQAVRAADTRICDYYLDRFGGLDHHLADLADRPSTGGIHGGYPLRQLSRHLIRAGRSEDLHHLLSRERLTAGSPQTVNVWYAAHKAAGSLDVYLDDVERARDICARDTDAAFGRRQPVAALGGEIRYSLMAASILSAIGKTDPMLVRHLLESGVWDVGRALVQVRLQRDPAYRARLTVMLVPALPESERTGTIAEAFAFARSSPDHDRRVLALSILVPHLPRAERDLALREALTTIQSAHASDAIRARMVACLAPHLEPRQLDQVVKVASELGDTDLRAEALTGALPYLPRSEGIKTAARVLAAISTSHDEWRRARLVAAAAPYLDSAALADAEAAAAALEDRTTRRTALVGLMPYVAEDRRNDLLGAVLATTSGSVGAELCLALVLTALSSSVTSDQVRWAAGHSRSLATGREWAEWAAVDLLARLRADQLRAAVAAHEAIEGLPFGTEHLAALAPLLRSDTMGFVVDAAHAIEDISIRGDVLTNLLPYLDDEQLTNAVRALLGVSRGWQSDSHRRLAVLLVLAADVTAAEMRQAVAAVRSLAGADPRMSPADRQFDQAETRWYGARQIHSELTPAVSVELPDGVGIDQLRATVAADEAIHGLRHGGRGLAALAGHLHSHAMQSVVNAAHQIEHDEARGNALMALVPYLDDDQLIRAAQQLLVAKSMFHTKPPFRLAVLLGMAAHLTADDIRGAVDRAREIVAEHTKNESRWSEVSDIIGDLSGRDRTAAALIHQVPLHRRTRAMADLLTQLQPGPAGEPVEVSDSTAPPPAAEPQADATGVVALDTGQADAVARLVPDLSSAQRATVRERAQAAVASGRSYDAVVLLCALIPYASGNQRTTLIEEALASLPGPYDSHRSAGLRGIAAAMLRRAQQLSAGTSTEHEAILVREFWRGLLRNRQRESCLEVVAAMAPWIAARGGTAAVEECIAAIDDVSRWWP